MLLSRVNCMSFTSIRYWHQYKVISFLYHVKGESVNVSQQEAGIHPGQTQPVCPTLTVRGSSESCGGLQIPLSVHEESLTLKMHKRIEPQSLWHFFVAPCVSQEVTICVFSQEVLIKHHFLQLWPQFVGSSVKLH